MGWELPKKSIGSLWQGKRMFFFLEKGIFPAFASHSGAGIISYSSPLSLSLVESRSQFPNKIKKEKMHRNNPFFEMRSYRF
jgi:hypothetical protein